jgi:DNA-binding winged helix-turn-helix (wHTH) protein
VEMRPSPDQGMNGDADGYDQNINFAARQIRVAPDVNASPVQTVPRRGYRFVRAVTEASYPYRSS